MCGPRCWTRHEYERLIDHGFLNEDDPIELLDGRLLVKEPQHGPDRTVVLLAPGFVASPYLNEHIFGQPCRC